jgi:hypothetical protein
MQASRAADRFLTNGAGFKNCELEMEGNAMPRYVVERIFKDGLSIPVNPEGAKACDTVISNNAEAGATWLQSFVSKDHKKTYCIYDGPNENAIRKAAERNGLPVDSIMEVSVLDPYFYH